MDEDTITDLKQFIAATVSQHTTGLRDSIVSDLRAEMREGFASVNKRIDTVDKKLDDLSTFVAEALDASNEANVTQLKDHEKRITHLEHRAA